MQTDGKDPKSFITNVMRKIMTDDVGETYSLSGKPTKNAPVKMSFEKTNIYKLISSKYFIIKYICICLFFLNNILLFLNAKVIILSLSLQFGTQS